MRFNQISCVQIAKYVCFEMIKPLNPNFRAFYSVNFQRDHCKSHFDMHTLCITKGPENEIQSNFMISNS